MTTGPREPVADVALLTDRRYEATAAAPGDWYLDNILSDDRLVAGALARRGLSAVRLDWARPGVDWSRFRCAVFRTTWDYFDRFPEFVAWLDRAASETRLCNRADTIRWNWDKHYLSDLAASGVPVVESRFLERGSALALADELAASGWGEAVLKPCVSGAARHTYRVDAGTAGAVEPVARELLVSESLVLQPFLRDVLTNGEDSLVVIGARVTHAVRKVPKPGDFRVQDDHGGTVRRHEPTREQVALAERAVAACDPVPDYARVDLVRDNGGRWAVMELELIEPELWLRFHPLAAEALADTIVSRLAG